MSCFRILCPAAEPFDVQIFKDSVLLFRKRNKGFFSLFPEHNEECVIRLEIKIYDCPAIFKPV